MENKLNKEALQQYCQEYCDAIMTDFFKEKESISGREILALNEVRQISLFIIYKILEQWNNESKKLESPFFNYDDPNVKKALRDYMNVLSQNILIKKEAFLPLFQSATEEAILLICSPYEYYTILAKREESVSIKNWKAFSKYIKINQGLFLSYIEKLEETGKPLISTEDAVEHLNNLFGKTSITPDDIDAYTAILSKTVNFRIDLIYGSEEGEDSTAESFVLSQAEENVNVVTLNDQLAAESTSLLEGIQMKKIESIKSHLSINQKFIFINQLFDGNTKDFNTVIDFLDRCGSQSEAMDFINNNFLKKKSWKKDNQDVKAFIEVVGRKYA